MEKKDVLTKALAVVRDGACVEIGVAGVLLVRDLFPPGTRTA